MQLYIATLSQPGRDGRGQVEGVTNIYRCVASVLSVDRNPREQQHAPKIAAIRAF